jgi:hypothetical protein
MSMENPLLKWLEDDEKLRDIIETIKSTAQNIEEESKTAFYKISEAYNTPKFPDSFTQEVYEYYESIGILNPTSVFEEVGKLRFLYPEDDPRGMVLMGVYNVKNNMTIDINECALKYFGSKKKIPNEYMIYYTGNDFDSQLHFLPNGESWTKPGVKYAAKILR